MEKTEKQANAASAELTQTELNKVVGGGTSIPQPVKPPLTTSTTIKGENIEKNHTFD